jgi:predicted GIY-YIG superfamily endonuclease
MACPWYVYIVANHTREEIYIGVVLDIGTDARPAGPKASVEDRWKDHCRGDTATISHWNCARDSTQLMGYCRTTSQRKASEYAHELERNAKSLARMCPEAAKLFDAGYGIHLTAGL